LNGARRAGAARLDRGAVGAALGPSSRATARGLPAIVALLAAGCGPLAAGCGARSCAAPSGSGPPDAGSALPAVADAGAEATRVASARPAGEVMAPHGQLSYDVRDAETGELIPCKLTLVGTSGTRSPELGRDDLPRQEQGAISYENRIMTLSGQGAIRLPHGTYDVHVSRGPEWELSVQRGVLVRDVGARVVATLRHVLKTEGWLSADFHVHAAPSFDSRVPMMARVYEFAADGVELLVSTDHNIISDYAPLIAELGAGRYLASAMGDEITTSSWGHFGAFPLPRDVHRPGHGAVEAHDRPPRAIFRSVRQQAPEAVLNVHHPRFDQGIGYFTVGELDAKADRAAASGFSFDFDALEVMNGYEGADLRAVERVMNDWFALLRHGHLVTATGNSDTHHLHHNIGGYPRNYVRLTDDRPSAARPGDVARALKQHRSFFTTAPFLEIAVGSAGMGELAPAPGGEARVTVTVQAAPWVDVSSVALYVDGVPARRWSVQPGTAALRLREELVIALPRDGFVVARADGARPLAPVVGDAEHFVVRPFALTNPIFLDVDGDGRYTPAESHGRHAR
jgi:hypothetical protein